jgi:hypothetical protein
VTASMSPQTSKAHVGRVSSVIYKLLWLSALPAALLSVIHLQKENQLGLSQSLAVILAITSAGLLILIYFDMEAIESLGAADHDYPDWVGAGRKSEVILRVLIVVFLLLAVGELHVVQHYGQLIFDRFYPQHDPNGNVVDAPSFLQFIRTSEVFACGSCGAFALIAAWNIAAFIQRCRSHKTCIAALQTKPVNQYAHYLIVYPRIALFVVLALICCFYWFFVWIASDRISSFATLFVVSYFVCVAVIAVLRFRRPGRYIESGLVKILETARSIR